jgi:hypothetical protein
MVINVYGAPSPFADVIIPLHLELNNNAQEMRVYSDSIPTVIGNVFEPDTFTNFWVHDFKMHVNGSQGSPFPLLTNPSRCAAGNFSASFGDTEGTRTPVATVPYTATDCATLPFAPTITQAFSSQAAGQQVGVSAEVNLPAGNSSMKSITVTEPVELAPRLASFGTPDDQCNAAAAPLPTSTFNPSFCPPQAAVGTLTIDSPLLSEPLTGTVYLIQKSPLPWLGVALNGTGANQGVSVRIVGVTSTPQDDPSCDPTDPDQHCDSDVRVAFVNLPDLPYTRVKLAIDGPSRTGVGGASLSGKILQVAQPQDSSCVPNGTAKTTFAPNSGGASVNTTQTFPFTGCSG